MKRNFTIIIVFILFFVCFVFFKNKSSYAIYREALNTKVYLSVLDSTSTYRVKFNTHGGTSVNPVDVDANNQIGTLPTTTKENHNFLGWYTEEDGGDKITPNTVVTGNVTYHAHWAKIVCKKAEEGTLHTETCSTGGSCLSLGYALNDQITYGNIPTANSPLAGDAYNCDVNNDGVYNPSTERFYFLRENNSATDTAALVHYTSYDKTGPMESSADGLIYNYTDGLDVLPGASLWTNSSLISFDNKVSRYISLDDLTATCGTVTYSNSQYFSTCQYFFENTRFQSSTLGRSGIWIESEPGSHIRIHTGSAYLATVADSSSNAVRPVIEIPYNTMDGYKEVTYYNITFDTNGGESIASEVRAENQPIGSLPTPTKEGFIFLGWYSDSSFETRVYPSTLVTGNMTLHANWEAEDPLEVVFRIPGSCSFGGSNGNITSTSNNCISDINPTGSEIDYTSSANKYIDTGISLYSEDNYEKDYEVGFTIDGYNGSSNVNQAVLFNSKLENSDLNYPGLVFRKAGNALFEIAQTIDGVKKNNNKLAFTNPITSDAPINVVIQRKDGIVSYSFNDGPMTELQDINDTEDYFDFHAWFGAAGTSAGADATTSTAQRILIGTLSNMYVKLENDNVTTHHVTFNAHDGQASFTGKDVRHGTAIGELPTVENSGYYFDGWYTEENGGTKITENTIVSSDITYHAHYKNIYLITFNVLGGELSIPTSTVEVIEGNTVTLPTATKTGLIFDGWYTAEEGGTKILGTEIINADDTYYAHYTSPITVYFDADGGTASFSSKEVGAGKPVGELPTAEKEGSEFAGWYTDNTYTTLVDPVETIINETTTFIAKWNTTSYVARVNNQDYETLAEAIAAVPTDGTKTVVTVLKDITLDSKVTISSGQNIEFDLQEFTISNATTTSLENYGTIEIKNGTITSSAANLSPIDNKEGGVLNVTGGTINSSKNNVIRNAGTVNITGGMITCSANSGAIDVSAGIVNISGGEVSVTGSSSGNIKQAVYNNGGTVNISGTAKLNSTSSVRAAVHNNAGTMNITGGEIISKNYSGIINNDTMTIGIDDDIIDNDSIIVQGKIYGLQINEGKTVTVYDGEFRGQGTTSNKAINDETLVVLKNNISIVHDTEIISGTQYDIAYLNDTVNRYTVTFNVNGGDEVSFNTKTVVEDDPISDLPVAKKTGTNFLGWYTAASGGEKILPNRIITSADTYYAHYTNAKEVCVPATTLHTSSGTNFGQIPTGDSLSPGDAFDCDVNKDGTYDATTERFYYLTDDVNNNAVLIYYNNINQGTSSCSSNGALYAGAFLNGTNPATDNLPSTTNWPNITLYSTPRDILDNSGTSIVDDFEYSSKVARFATLDEIKAATTSSISGINNELANYEFLLENTQNYDIGCGDAYWLETLNSSDAYKINGASDSKSLDISSTAAESRPVIEVPYNSIQGVKKIVNFDIMSPALRTYYDNISTWASGQTDSNHSSYDSYMTNNLNDNDCVYFSETDNRESENLHTYCDQPNKYDTGVSGNVDVYEYNVNTSSVGAKANYVTSSDGKLYNMIPGKTYYWESEDDESINGYVKATGERRMISIDNSPNNQKYKVRNVRDLGGISVSYENAGGNTVSGKIKYGKLYRGEKIWGGSNYGPTSQFFTKLGITNEMDLREDSAGASTVTNEERLSNRIIRPDLTNTFQIVHYEIDYTVSSERTNYIYARDALKKVMQEFVNAHNNNNDNYALYFHCAIGSDRTGTLAYLIEGILGASEEERYRDFELSAFYGMRSRTRFYYNKDSNTHKFQYMKQAIKNSSGDNTEDVLKWYLRADEGDQTLIDEDMTLIQSFRSIMVE